MGKKKRAAREAAEEVTENGPDDNAKAETKLELLNVDSSERKKKKKKKKRNKEQNDGDSNETPTVSIALPGSIIDNAQSLELATRVTPLLLSLRVN